MPGAGTQTGIDKATNVERTRNYIANLRGQPHVRAQNKVAHHLKTNNAVSHQAKAKTVTLSLPELVEDRSNAPLHKAPTYTSYKGKHVSL